MNSPKDSPRPAVLFASSLHMLEASSGKQRRGKFGSFQFADIRATAEAAIARSAERLQRIDELSAKHGAATLVLEASLTPAELADLFVVAAGAGACLFAGGLEAS